MGLKKLGIKTGSWLLNVGSKSGEPRQPKSLTTANSVTDGLDTEACRDPSPLNELACCESTPNLLGRCAPNDPSPRHGWQRSSSSSPKSLLRMFSTNKQRKRETSTALPGSQIDRTARTNPPPQTTPRPRSNTLQQPPNLIGITAAPSKSTLCLAPPNANSHASSFAGGNVDAEGIYSTTFSIESVRPFTTAAPASAASFTITPPSSHPTSSKPLELGASASFRSGPPSKSTELAPTASLQRGSAKANHRPTKSECTLKELTKSEAANSTADLAYAHPASRALPATSGVNSGAYPLSNDIVEIYPSANSPTIRGGGTGGGLAALRQREPSGSYEDNGACGSEIARLTRELAELGQDRDRQVGKLGALCAELARAEATLQSEQVAGRQEVEALLELRAQHQTLQRTLREREAANQTLVDERAGLEKRLADTLALLHEANTNTHEALLAERNQLRGWLDEEKERHNEVRAELAQAKTSLRTSHARIAHLEAISQEQRETIQSLQKRDTDANESALREINYYQEQLNEALRSRDELRDELDRTKEQVRVLRNSMEQLLKAGVADDPPPFPPRPTHSKTHPNPSFANLGQDPIRPTKSHSHSPGSEDLESITSSDFLGMASVSGSIRHGLGGRQATYGPDATTAPPPCNPQVNLADPSSDIAPTFSPSSPKVEPAQPSAGPDSDKADSRYWDQRLKELLKQKDHIHLEYSRIPTSKLSISVRRRKESLERALDQLDADISGARSKIRALVI
ncbi:hypothetical protein L0F63_006156 [Massospora cicadina]|nr:hypothetical protein L0F63_006156 [Massospora cicadina]